MALPPGLPIGRASPVPACVGLPERGNGCRYHERGATRPANELTVYGQVTGGGHAGGLGDGALEHDLPSWSSAGRAIFVPERRAGAGGGANMAKEVTVPGDEHGGPTVGHGSGAFLPSLCLLRGSRPATLVGLYMDLVSSPQLLEKHEVIPPFDPHARPNGQDHLAAVSQCQYHHAFAYPRSLATPVDADGLNLPPVLLQVAPSPAPPLLPAPRCPAQARSRPAAARLP